jgi:hypothetical protein
LSIEAGEALTSEICAAIAPVLSVAAVNPATARLTMDSFVIDESSQVSAAIGDNGWLRPSTE